MKRVVGALIVFVAVLGITAFNVWHIVSLAKDVEELSLQVYDKFEEEDWDGIEGLVKEMSDVWHKNRLWTAITLPTSQIDEIEISLEQSLAYSEIGAKEDFIGEFKMFCMLIEHLPKQETLSLAELL